MASNFFSNTLAQVGAAAAQASAQTEVRVGGRTVQIHRRIAEGGFGVVELVSDIYTKQEMVLKRCNIDRQESFDIANTEIKMLQKFKGPYVVNLLDSCVYQKSKTTREAFLLMEYYPGDHLLNRLLQRNGAHLPQDAIFRMFGQLCLAVKDMHLSRPAIVHRDIKLENVLFGQDGKVRMCDFGSCVESPIYIRNVDERQAADEHIQKETTQMYRAPEMVDLYLRPTLTEKTDIWALGCMLYAMCFLIHPFMDGSSLGILNAKVHFPADSPFSEDLHALILRILDIDPECRPNIVELIDLVTTLAHGKPLPPQVLSPEAEQCRAARIASTQLRESKANNKLKAKQAAKPAPKAPVPLSSNSVAARRLAAMRGQPLPNEPMHRESRYFGGEDFVQQHHSPVDDDDAETFDPFAQQNQAVSAVSVPARASFSAPARASFSAPTAPAVASFAAFDTSLSPDPFGAASASASSAMPSAFPEADPSGGFANFSNSAADAWDQPAFGSAPTSAGFDAFAPTSAPIGNDGFTPTGAVSKDAGFSAHFDAFEPTPAPTSAAADDGFTPTGATTAAGFPTAFDHFDGPVGVSSFSPTSSAADNDGFFSTPGAFETQPTTSRTVESSFNPFEVAEDSPTPFTAQPAVYSENFFDTSDEVTPTAATGNAGAATTVFFGDDDDNDFSAAAAVPTPATRSAASQLFSNYEPEPVHDAWASTVPIVAAAAPAPPSAPTAPSLIDVFGDDLLLPASTQSSVKESSWPTPTANKPRNPLDLLSLYDQPLTPAPKNAMMGSSPAGMGAAAGRGMGMSPMGNPGSMNMSTMGAPSPMGFRPAAVPMQPMQPMQGMGIQGMQGGRGGPALGQRGGPMMSPTGGSGSMYGGSPVPTGSASLSGRPPQPYVAPSRPSQQQSLDPFDSINMLKR